MPDDLVDLDALLTTTANSTPEELQSMLPPATNPGAHAPASGNLTSDEIIAKQANEAAAANVENPAPVSESQVDTETQTEQESEQPQISAKDALFEQLRVQFPNESLVNLAARAEAAFSSEPTPVDSGNEGDVFAEILSDYESLIRAAEEAESQVTSLLNPEDGTMVEYTKDIRDAEQRAMEAKFEVKSAFTTLAHEANDLAEEQFPELRDPNSLARVALDAALQANPTIKDSSPVALANLARSIAGNIRQAAPPQAPIAPKPSASPTRVPAPAGPKPPVSGLASSVQAPHASAATPAPGTQQGTDVVSKIRGAGSIDDLETMFFGKGLKNTVLS